ncbi:MAG: hypothetical protein JXR44_03435 [Thiotrichales bacterium]|nr:hypothetical protein [Thiotrichales bacterium]
MTDYLPASPNTPPVSSTVPTLIYILYLLNLLVPFTSLIGLILAYVNKGDGNYLDSHYRFQIRTFWIGLLIGLIGAVMTLIMIGWLVLGLLVIWLIIRCAIGLKYLGRRSAIPNPASWGFGN